MIHCFAPVIRHPSPSGSARVHRLHAPFVTEKEIAAVVDEGLKLYEPTLRSGFVILPLETRSGDRGCMVLEMATLPAEAIEPCAIYARQVVQSLESILLFDRVDRKQLAGVVSGPGDVRTPSIADFFVAVVENQDAQAQGAGR